MTLYRGKSALVEAVQWTGTFDSASYCVEFAPGKVRVKQLNLTLLAGKDGSQEWVPVPVRHWLVCQPGDESDVWPVDDDYFRNKYDKVRTGPMTVGELLHSLLDLPPTWGDSNTRDAVVQLTFDGDQHFAIDSIIDSGCEGIIAQIVPFP